MGVQVLSTCLKLSLALFIVQLITCAASDPSKNKALASEKSVTDTAAGNHRKEQPQDIDLIRAEVPPPLPRTPKCLASLKPLLDKLKSLRPIIWEKIQRIMHLPVKLQTPQTVKRLWNSYNGLKEVNSLNEASKTSVVEKVKQTVPTVVGQSQAADDQSAQAKVPSANPDVAKGKPQEPAVESKLVEEVAAKPPAPAVNSQVAQPVQPSPQTTVAATVVPPLKTYGWNLPQNGGSHPRLPPPLTHYGYPLYEFDYYAERKRTEEQLKNFDYAKFFKWLLEEEDRRTKDFGAFLKRLLGEPV